MSRKFYAAAVLLFWLPISAFAPLYAQELRLPSLSLPAAAPAGEGDLRLLSLRAEKRGNDGQSAVRLIAVFSRKPDYTLLLLDNPPRLIVTLPPARFLFDSAALQPGEFLQTLRYGANGAGHARLIFGFKKPFQLQNARLEALSADSADKDAAWQLILELRTVKQAEFRRYLAAAHPNSGALSPPAAAQSAARAAAPFIVVIDAGHGDFDSGAIGLNGIREKQVTLAFAKALYQRLLEKPDIKPALTRADDVFLPLGNRVEKARAAQADLFISIHADHNDAPSAQGATVYSLSGKASDTMAKLLAERENKSDSSQLLPAAAPPAVADILLDMTRRETQLFSENFARLLIKSLRGGGIALIKNPHRFADFQVLRTADIPAALLELGYLSNPQDTKNITDSAWRDKTAESVADAITLYARAHKKPQ